MTGLRLRALTAYLRWVEKPWLARVRDLPALRHGFERSARLGFRAPPYTLALPDRVGGRPALWVACRARHAGAILYLHGGAYLMGSPETHRALVAALSGATGLPALLPDYRLAPEHPFPAALEDARAAWNGLIARGYPPDRIVLAGDSAGGGLALALLAGLLAEGQRPAATVAFSPWTDLTLSGASLAENATADPLLPVSRLSEAREYYLQGADPANPGASPLFAAFPDPPPVFLQVAETEILRDDTLRMADRLRSHGAEVALDLWPDAPHVWAIFQGRLPEADAALARAANFVTARFPAPRPSDS